ncbi:MAG: ABC transporter permease [Clostridia bacterium]|nr:ABC transporter permease [Clostridia bacterium]
MIKEKLVQLNGILLKYYGFTAFLLLWQVASTEGWVDRQFITPPTDILKAAWELFITGDLLVHVSISLTRVFVGLILAVLTAIPLGFLLGGFFPKAAKFLNPLLQLLGQINAFALFPIFIMLFGIKETGKYSVIYWASIWPILFTTLAGVENVDPLLIKCARAMGANKITTFLKVILPSGAPSIFTGFRMGSTTAFLMLIAAEMLGSSAGLGWLVYNSNMNNIFPRLYVAIVTIALLAMGLNYLLLWAESSLIRWKEQVLAE